MRKTQVRNELFYPEIRGVGLTCEIEYTPPCPGSREGGQLMEPGEPEECELIAAFVGGFDIASLLSDEVTEEIEQAFLTQDRSE